MSTDAASISSQFRDVLIQCKRFYISAAKEVLDARGDTDQTARHDYIRRMVDLHKGLVVKVYVTVAKADRQWSAEERQLAQTLIDHLWQLELHGQKLREASKRLFRDAGCLKWYSLVRPFDQMAVLRDRVAELETIVMRLANLVAKVDGQISRHEVDAVRGIQREIDTLLKRLPLDEPEQHEQEDHSTAQAVQILHQESSLAQKKSSAKEADTAEQSNSDNDERESFEQAVEKLDKLVGLEQVKKEINTLTNFLKLQQRRKQAGLPQHDLSLHMIFMGNPGTGKTTVARIVGKIFQALGLLSKGHLIETDRSGLVAEYAGQTGPKTNRKIDEALDGILFIDEAYSLVANAQEDTYGREAVQALVKRMEDHRDRLVLILAGYPEPIQQLLQSNPGLTSRFNTQMTFADYTCVSLGQIFDRMSQTNHYVLPAKTRAKLLLGFQWLYDHRDEHFGNGRLVRNVFEDSIRCLANRIADVAPITAELLSTLTPDDILMDGVPPATWDTLKDGSAQFVLTCQKCGKSVKVEVRHLGRVFQCPHCKDRLRADWGCPKMD